MSNFKPICMAEDFWANSQFSIARHYGHINIDGHRYVIVNKEGKDIFECSVEADRAGRDKAIESGEPCDLCREDFIKYYRRLGRDKFLEVLKFYPHADEKELRGHFQRIINEQKNAKKHLKA